MNVLLKVNVASDQEKLPQRKQKKIDGRTKLWWDGKGITLLIIRRRKPFKNHPWLILPTVIAMFEGWRNKNEREKNFFHPDNTPAHKLKSTKSE